MVPSFAKAPTAAKAGRQIHMRIGGPYVNPLVTPNRRVRYLSTDVDQYALTQDIRSRAARAADE
jgi:hypothetical protein